MTASWYSRPATEARKFSMTQAPAVVRVMTHRLATMELSKREERAP